MSAPIRKIQHKSRKLKNVTAVEEYDIVISWLMSQILQSYLISSLLGIQSELWFCAYAVCCINSLAVK
jgi:hypothetical protein